MEIYNINNRSDFSKMIVLSGFLFLFSLPSFASEVYYIYFKDKECNIDLINFPEKFLSQQAISRRINQNISIVNNDLPVCKSYLDILKQQDLEILQISKWLNAAMVRISDINSINSLDFVKKVEKPGIYRSDLKKEMLNEARQQLNYGFSFAELDLGNGICLHENGFLGESMNIAVIDAGFINANELACFQHLYDNGKVKGTYDFVDKDNNVYDGSSHGTSVWSLMGSYLPDIFIGAAPMANYWLLKSEDASSETLEEEFNWIAAAEFADSAGVDVINTSLGYTLFDDESEDHSYDDMDGNTTPISIAADIAASKGIFVVNSAGNSGNSSWKYISAPADGDSVIAIGAVDENGIKASFSSFGPSSDGQIKPDFASFGSGNNVYSSSGDVVTGSGTSFAAPIFAGLAACLWQANPGLNNMDLFQLIREDSDQYLNPDDELGYGLPDFCLSLNKTKLQISTNDQYFTIYPNPVITNYYILFNRELISENSFLQITDMNGKVIFYKQILDFAPDFLVNSLIINDFQNGLYILTLFESKEEKQSFKLVNANKYD